MGDRCGRVGKVIFAKLAERTRTMIIKAVFIVGVLMAMTDIASVAQSLDSRVVYSSLGSSSSFIALDLSDDSVVLGDLAFPAEFCRDDQDYHCVRSDPLHFSVPRDLNGKQSWTVDGHTFEIVRRGPISILGTTLDATWISLEREDEGVRFLFIYSEQMGLIAFRTTTRDGESNTYLLSGEAGFAVKREGSDLSLSP